MTCHKLLLAEPRARLDSARASRHSDRVLTSSLNKRLAVCSWSPQPQSPRQLIDQLKTIGIPRVQIALDPLRTEPAIWGSFPELCAKEGIEMVSGMFGTVGEDYTTMETIRLT